MAEMKDVVAKLAMLTEQRQVPWKTTVDKSTFAATFGKMSVLISSDSQSYRLSVLDEQGSEIEFATATVTDNSLSHWPAEIPEFIMSLYASAKRTALDVDRRLDELLNEMDRVSNS